MWGRVGGWEGGLSHHLLQKISRSTTHPCTRFGGFSPCKVASVSILTVRRPVVMKRWQIAAFLLATQLCSSAAFRDGDVVHMSQRRKVAGKSDEKRESSWEEALRSQMPHFGRPGTVRFNPAPADGAPDSPEEDELAVAFAFSEEQFVLRPVPMKERRRGGGNSSGALLKKLVVTFACAAGDIVTVRSDTVYGDTPPITNDLTADPAGFDIEYRWDRLPEEDAQAGLWVVFAASLVLTVLLAADACNSPTEDDGVDGQDDGRAETSTPTSGYRGRDGREGSGTRLVGGEGGIRRRR